jgi:type II secretory pathway pseudopilin PulG
VKGQQATYRRRRRCGLTLFEMGVALAILSAAAIALVQLVSVATRQRRATYQRLAAATEVANQAEHIALLDWESVAPHKLTTWEPSDVLRAAIPQSNRRVIVTEQTESPICRRIDFRLSWTGPAGQQVEPVKLTIWKFPSEARP